MTGTKYRDVDVPFCVLCSRFMVINIGLIQVALNYESDPVYTLRAGKAYKCPQCGHIVIYKWEEGSFKIRKNILERYKHWIIFLESHTHRNKFVGLKD